MELKLSMPLESELRSWEDRCYILETVGKALVPSRRYRQPYAISGQIKNWRSFRSHLLEANSVDFNQENFHFPQNALSHLRSPAYFPESIFAWTKNSRRIYSLSSELQSMLEATSLKDILWEDLHFPFNSFIVSLANPIYNDALSKSYFDFVLVNKCVVDGEERLHFYMFSKEKQYVPISQKEKDDFAQVIMKRKGDEKKWVERIGSYWKMLDQEHFVSNSRKSFFYESSLTKRKGIILSMSLENLVSEDVLEVLCLNEGVDKEGILKMASFVEKIERVVAGLMLYFNTLPNEEYKSLSWRGRLDEAIESQQCISNEDLVCAVAYSNKCNHETQGEHTAGEEVERKKYSAQCGHKREGYFRRERGQGKNPLAEKTVWIEPYSVNMDSQEQTLPVGLEKAIG